MLIRNWTTEEEIKALLNFLPPKPSSYARFLARFLEAPKVTDGVSVLRKWADDKNLTIKTRWDGFLQNYLAMAPTVVASPEVQIDGWTLPPKVSRKRSYPMRAALTSAYLRVYVD